MDIANVRHKGLKRLLEEDDPVGLPAAALVKIRDILTFLDAMAEEAELANVPSWRAHRLSGDRKGTWSLHVTKNWRITFRIDRADAAITDLDFEDYHEEESWARPSG